MHNYRVNYAVLPYDKGATDQIGNILKKYNIKTIFKPFNKIKRIIRLIN